MSPYADPDFDLNTLIDPNAPEGGRTLRHAIIEGATGHIVSHKTGHEGIGALIRAMAGDFLSNKRYELKQHICEDWGNPSNRSGSQPTNTSGIALTVLAITIIVITKAFFSSHTATKMTLVNNMLFFSLA
jgi:hypothetical protein